MVPHVWTYAKVSMVLRLVIIAGLLGFPLEGLAQTTTGSVRVLARDEANAVLPGVRVVLDGPVHREGATNQEGVAAIDQLPSVLRDRDQRTGSRRKLCNPD